MPERNQTRPRLQKGRRGEGAGRPERLSCWLSVRNERLRPTLKCLGGEHDALPRERKRTLKGDGGRIKGISLTPSRRLSGSTTCAIFQRPTDRKCRGKKRGPKKKKSAVRRRSSNRYRQVPFWGADYRKKKNRVRFRRKLGMDSYFKSPRTRLLRWGVAQLSGRPKGMYNVEQPPPKDREKGAILGKKKAQGGDEVI